MNGWRKACWVLAILVAVGLAVLVGVRKKGEQPDETDKSSVLAEGPAVWQSIEGFVSEMGGAANTEQSEGVISGEMPGPEPRKSSRLCWRHPLYSICVERSLYQIVAIS